jgi:large subunit ribosomal protein L7A
VILAKDATEKIMHTIKDLCEEKKIEIVYVQDMKQLGKACGIDVGAAVVCVVDE